MNNRLFVTSLLTCLSSFLMFGVGVIMVMDLSLTCEVIPLRLIGAIMVFSGFSSGAYIAYRTVMDIIQLEV